MSRAGCPRPSGWLRPAVLGSVARCCGRTGGDCRAPRELLWSAPARTFAFSTSPATTLPPRPPATIAIARHRPDPEGTPRTFGAVRVTVTGYRGEVRARGTRVCATVGCGARSSSMRIAAHVELTLLGPQSAGIVPREIKPAVLWFATQAMIRWIRRPRWRRTSVLISGTDKETSRCFHAFY